MSNIDHPDHYLPGPFEVINVIEAHGLGFHLGNAVKYVLRAGKKSGSSESDDLKKAIWYLKRRLALLGEPAEENPKPEWKETVAEWKETVVATETGPRVAMERNLRARRGSDSTATEEKPTAPRRQR